MIRKNTVIKVFFLLFILILIELILTQMLQKIHPQIGQQLQINIKSNHIRILANQTSAPSNKKNQGSYIDLDQTIVIVIIVIVVVGTVFIISFIIIVCFIQHKQRQQRLQIVSITTNRIHSMYCPEISYEKYLTIGKIFDMEEKRFQNQCVICLQQFSKQNIKTIIQSDSKLKSILSELDVQSDKIIKNQQSNQVQIQLRKVKLTYCGHLMHALCLDKWLQKQYRCPICCQHFTEQNIKKWQQLLDMKLLGNLYKNLRIQNNNEIIKNQQNNEVIIDNISNYQQQSQDEQNKRIKIIQKIIKYHRKQSIDKKQVQLQQSKNQNKYLQKLTHLNSKTKIANTYNMEQKLF